MFGPGTTWPRAVNVAELILGQPVMGIDDQRLGFGDHGRAAADREIESSENTPSTERLAPPVSLMAAYPAPAGSVGLGR